MARTDRGITRRALLVGGGAAVVAAGAAGALVAGPALCAVGGGGYSYWHERADGADTLRMLTEEVVPTVRADLGVKRRRNAILGVSMGGYGALNAAARRPDLFAVAVGSSPALWRSRAEQEGAVPEAFMTAAEFRENDLITGPFWRRMAPGQTSFVVQILSRAREA